MLNATELTSRIAAIAAAAKDATSHKASANGESVKVVDLVRALAIDVAADMPDKVKEVATLQRIALLKALVPKGTADPMVAALSGYVTAIGENVDITKGGGAKGDKPMPAITARGFNLAKAERDARRDVKTLRDDIAAALGRVGPSSFTDSVAVAKSIVDLTAIRDHLNDLFPVAAQEAGTVTTSDADAEAAKALAAIYAEAA